MPVTKCGLSTTRFSCRLDTAMLGASTHPLQHTQPSTNKPEQARAGPFWPRGAPGPAVRGTPAFPGKPGREGGGNGDGHRRRQWHPTLRYREGREHLPRAQDPPRPNGGGAGLLWRLRRARVIPGEIAMTTPAPFPSTETPPEPFPAHLGGAADAPSAHPGRRNRTEERRERTPAALPHPGTAQ